MFDKSRFAQILKNINETYESQRDFAKKSGINRTYLSQYMNMKLDEPPKPKTLKKIAQSSNNLIKYDELMKICGYIDNFNSNTMNKELFSLYDKLNNVEESYNLVDLNLSAEEIEIFASLTNQVVSALFDKKTPETFNANEIIKDIDFISDSSKNKIIVALQLEFNNLYYKDKIEKQISDIKYPKTHKYEFNSLMSNSQFYMCPVYGRIAAGQPNWAEECIEGRIPIDPVLFNIADPEEHFFLRVNRRKHE